MSDALQLAFAPLTTPRPSQPNEKSGVVYTRPWVVELLLDLAGYRAGEDLVSCVAVEPAAGDGAFLEPMVRRLVASCQRQALPLTAIGASLRAYEIDETAAVALRSKVARLLLELGAQTEMATDLARSWIHTSNYLIEWPRAPAADFVIGNPPYIRLEDIPGAIGTAYRRMYRTMIGRADIYVAFFEAALRQLKPGGVCGFICADRWMLNHYGTELRRFITANFSVDAVIEMHRTDAFQHQVSAYPAVTVLRKAAQGAVIVASAGVEAGMDGATGLADALAEAAAGSSVSTVPRGFRAARVDGWFRGADPWPQVSPERLALLKRLEADFDPLENPITATRVTIGVATGADDIFVTQDANVVESSRLLPLAMAFDTRDGTLHWSGHYLINPWEADGRLVDLAAYPRLKAYYEARRPVLATRHVAAKNPHNWYRTIDRVHHQLTTRPKLYLPDIKGVIHPVLDAGTTYPHHNLYVVYSSGWDLEVLGGLLLSSVAQFFIECYAVRMRGGWLRFQAQYLRRIRLPRPEAIPADAADTLRHAFRGRDVVLADSVAFDLYGIQAIPREDDHGC